MRSLFGVSQDALLVGITLTVLVVVVVLGAAAWRNPLLPRLAWRNLPRRPDVAAVVPIIVEQLPVASEGQAFAARLNVMGVPSQDALTLRSVTDANAALRVDDLGLDEVYVNTEAATALGVTTGQQVHAYDVP